MLVQTIIKGTIHQLNEAKQLNVSKAICDNIYSHQTNEHSKLELVHQGEVTEDLTAVLNQEHKQDNAIQRQTGVDMMAYGRR